MKETRLAASETSDNYRPFSDFAHYYDSTATATLNSAYNVKHPKGKNFPTGYQRESDSNHFSSAYHIRKPKGGNFDPAYPMVERDRREPPHRFVSDKNIPLNYGSYRGEGIPIGYDHSRHHYGQYGPYHPGGGESRKYYDPRRLAHVSPIEEGHMVSRYIGEGSYPRYPKQKESFSASKKPHRIPPPYEGYGPERDRPMIPGYRYPPKAYENGYAMNEFYSQREMAYNSEKRKHRPIQGEKKMRFRSDMNISMPMQRGRRRLPPGEWAGYAHPEESYEPYWPSYHPHHKMRDAYDPRRKTPLATQNEFAEVEEEEDETLQRVNVPF